MIFESSPDSDRVPVDRPPPAPWSAAAVRLLQGVVYYDDNQDVWDTLLKSQSTLADYFGKLAVELVVNESDGFAYLKQAEDEESDTNSPATPRLFRRTPLSYDTTLLCVLLRDALREYEEQDLQNQRCVIAQAELLDLWRAFFPGPIDDVRLNRSLVMSLRRLEELKFVRQFEKEPASWEIRRILKARLPLSDLERLRRSLIEEVEKRSPGPDAVSAGDVGAGDIALSE
jgi:hypothetical protein